MRKFGSYNFFSIQSFLDSIIDKKTIRFLLSKILSEFFLFLGLFSKSNDNSSSFQFLRKIVVLRFSFDKNFTFYVLLLFLFCFVSEKEILGSEDKLENYKQIRKCSDKLESCLKKCNEEFPHFRSSRRGVCKDVCVQISKEREGCLIYYSSSRR